MGAEKKIKVTNEEQKEGENILKYSKKKKATSIYPILTLCVRFWVVMGEIRWKLKVMFLNNDTLNTIEAQYGSKTADIIHQFELFLMLLISLFQQSIV